MHFLIIKQWKQEIELFPLRYRIILKKKDILDLKNSSLEEDIILCVAGLYNKLMEVFELYAWKRFIYMMNRFIQKS